MSQVSRACPVCQHPHAEPVFDNRMSLVGGFDMSYTIGCCQACGFHYAFQLTDAQTFHAYYAAVSKYDVATQVYALDLLRIEAAVKLCESHIPKSDFVIDLGCGYGAFLAGLKTKGWHRLHGVDPAPHAAQRARELFGFSDIHWATLSQAHTVVPLDQADLVCFMAVLEHLPNLHRDLYDFLAHLRPGCRILVEVPAVEYFVATDSEPFGEFSLEHIQYFSAVSLQNLFHVLGCTTIATEYQALPQVRSGSVFGLFQKLDQMRPLVHTLTRESHAGFSEYVAACSQAFNIALRKLPQQPFLIYGAGSHTARLLARLDECAEALVLAVVDGNPNLQGKTIGRWTIQAPQQIVAFPGIPVLVSSFRSQDQIATMLKERYANPLVLMYGT